MRGRAGRRQRGERGTGGGGEEVGVGQDAKEENEVERRNHRNTGQRAAEIALQRDCLLFIILILAIKGFSDLQGIVLQFIYLQKITIH